MKKYKQHDISSGVIKCISCNEVKSLDNYYFRRCYYNYTCKVCNSVKRKEWSQTEQGKITIKENKKRYNQRQSLKKSDELERKRNIEMELYDVTTWEDVLKIKRRESDKRKWKKRYESDSLFKFRKLIQNNVRNSFKRKGFSKTSKCREILGADWETVKKYFESKFLDGMSWDNQGEWHIDHILPISTAVTEEDVLRLNHYTNLQPLWAEDNIMKSDVLTTESYIKKHFPYCEINVDVSNEVTNTEVKVSDEYKFGWGVF
jgi:hypothetical protein